MAAIAESFNLFIKQQVNDGIVFSETEAERVVGRTIEERATDRMLQERLAHMDTDIYVDFDDAFIQGVIKRGRELAFKSRQDV